MHDNTKRGQDNIKMVNDNIMMIKNRKSRPSSSPSPSIFSINSSINELRELAST